MSYLNKPFGLICWKKIILENELLDKEVVLIIPYMIEKIMNEPVTLNQALATRIKPISVKSLKTKKKI